MNHYAYYLDVSLIINKSDLTETRLFVNDMFIEINIITIEYKLIEKNKNLYERRKQEKEREESDSLNTI